MATTRLQNEKDCRCREGILEEPGIDTPARRREFILSLPRNRFGEIIAPAGHNCAYIRARNRLIPVAEQEACRVAGPEPGRADKKHPTREEQEAESAWNARWTKAFHSNMENMAKEW